MPRYHTNGASKCPGCAGEGFLERHPACGILLCSQRKDVEYCYLCDKFPCKKYDGADQSDSFITHLNQLHDFDKAKMIGLEVYEAELNDKIEILGQLLENYDDGRRKSFFCTAVNLLDIQDVNSVMAQIADKTKADESVKVKSGTAVRLFQTMADEQNVSLILRKRKKL